MVFLHLERWENEPSPNADYKWGDGGKYQNSGILPLIRPTDEWENEKIPNGILFCTSTP